MRQETTVPREQLYRELWTEPAQVVAKRYGISDVGLAKVCRRYGIPKPGLGYWAQRQHGKAPDPEPLPPAQEPALETVVFQAGEQTGTNADAPEYRREKDPEWRIEVPADLKLSHALVTAADVALRRRRGEKSGNQPVRWNDRYRAQLSRPGCECLDIAVSKPLIPRALRIMQALIAAVERRGYSVSVTPKGKTIIRVLDEDFQIALNERLKQVQVKHTYGTGVDLAPWPSSPQNRSRLQQRRRS